MEKYKLGILDGKKVVPSNLTFTAGEIDVAFSKESEQFARDLRKVMDNLMEHRDIFKENAIVIPHSYASDVAAECGQICLVPVEYGPYFVCQYGDFKIFTSPHVSDVHFAFQTSNGEDITNKDLYKPFMGLFEEDK